jgi:hypothetical protein
MQRPFHRLLSLIVILKIVARLGPLSRGTFRKPVCFAVAIYLPMAVSEYEPALPGVVETQLLTEQARYQLRVAGVGLRKLASRSLTHHCSCASETKRAISAS